MHNLKVKYIYIHLAQKNCPTPLEMFSVQQFSCFSVLLEGGFEFGKMAYENGLCSILPKFYSVLITFNTCRQDVATPSALTSVTVGYLARPCRRAFIEVYYGGQTIEMFTSVKLKQNLGKHLSTKYEVSMQTCSVSNQSI